MDDELPNFSLRPAVPQDIPAMLALLDKYVRQQLVLPRTAEELQQNYRNFTVACNEADGRLLGIAALRPFGDGFYEVRSLAVDCEFQGRGLGGALVKALLERARNLQPPASCVFALTKRPHFFQWLGFQLAKREAFPAKIWLDCRQCPKFDCCDEIAVEYRLERKAEA